MKNEEQRILIRQNAVKHYEYTIIHRLDLHAHETAVGDQRKIRGGSIGHFLFSVQNLKLL